MTQILIPWYVTIALMFKSVTGATCLLVKSEKSQINKLLPLEVKDIIPQASSQSNGYGVTTLENCTSTLLNMYDFCTIPNQHSERNLFRTTVE